MFHSESKLIERLAASLDLSVIHGDVMTCVIRNKDQAIITEGGYPYVIMNLRHMIKANKERNLINKLNARVTAVNNVHSFLDVVSTELKEYFAGGYKVNKSGTAFYTKDSEAIQAIIDNHKNSALYIEIAIKGSWIKLKARALYYPDGKTSDIAEYYSNWINVWDRDFEKAETRDQHIDLWTLEEMIEIHAKLPIVEKQLKELQLLHAQYTHKLG
tara:strand:- start:19096 stop:19740 length:645 start_codon:yes stop_codon:yes gene_type:complete